MRRLKRIVKIWLSLNATLAVILVLMPGRKIANASPKIRGGGDWGFGYNGEDKEDT